MELQENFIQYGMLLVHRYVPEKVLPEKVRDGDYEHVSMEEFFELVAKADLMHELAIEDIRAGFLKALNDMTGGGT